MDELMNNINSYKLNQSKILQLKFNSFIQVQGQLQNIKTIFITV